MVNRRGSMKKAVVLGATGGMGYALTKELGAQNYEVTAFARNKQKLHTLFGHMSSIIICPGDVLVLEELERAVKGSDIIFHAINLPYAMWGKYLKRVTNNIISVARKHNIKLAIVDNIYSYGKKTAGKVKETTVKNPHTKKGKIRLNLELLYQESNVRYVHAHFPDFYGPF